MQIILSEDEYKDLEARAIPKEVFEKWQKDNSEMVTQVSQEVVEIISRYVFGPDVKIMMLEMKTCLAKLANVKLPHQQ